MYLTYAGSVCNSDVIVLDNPHDDLIENLSSSYELSIVLFEGWFSS
jgi:hypothetical protein